MPIFKVFGHFVSFKGPTLASEGPKLASMGPQPAYVVSTPATDGPIMVSGGPRLTFERYAQARAVIGLWGPIPAFGRPLADLCISLVYLIINVYFSEYL